MGLVLVKLSCKCTHVQKKYRGVNFEKTNKAVIVSNFALSQKTFEEMPVKHQKTKRENEA